MKKLIYCWVAFLFIGVFPLSASAKEQIQSSNKANLESSITLEKSEKYTVSSQLAINTAYPEKATFPNTGEKKGFFLSLAGIGVILLVILFLFIKSKKGDK